MKAIDLFRTVLRFVTSRFTESLLLVLGSALGVGLTAAVISFLGSYNARTERLLSHPAYREILVSEIGEGELVDTPALPLGDIDKSDTNLTEAYLEAAKAAAPDV